MQYITSGALSPPPNLSKVCGRASGFENPRVYLHLRNKYKLVKMTISIKV